MKTWLAVFVTLVLLGTGLGWAGGQKEAGESAARTQVKTLTWWFGEWNEPRGTNLARKFEQENPGYKVDVEPFQGQGMQDKMLVAFRSGSTPDVLAIPVGWTVPFAKQGHLATLDDRIGDLDKSDFFPGAWNTAVLEGKVYGIPYRSEAHGFFYNKAMYRDAGLDPQKPPETWEQLLEYAQRMTRPAQSQYGYGITGGGEKGNTTYLLLPMIYMNGGAVLSDDYSRAVIDQPPAVAAIRRYTDYYVKYKVAPPSTLENDGSAIRRLFEQSVIAQMQTGQYALPNIKKAEIDVGTAMIPHPAGKQTAALLGGWNYTIPKDAKAKDAAWTFIRFMTTPENMAEFTDTFPARESAMDAPRFQDPLLVPFGKMLPYARTTPPIEQWPQISDGIMFPMVQNIMLERKTVEQAVSDARKEIDDLLK